MLKFAELIEEAAKPAMVYGIAVFVDKYEVEDRKIDLRKLCDWWAKNLTNELDDRGFGAAVASTKPANYKGNKGFVYEFKEPTEISKAEFGMAIYRSFPTHNIPEDYYDDVEQYVFMVDKSGHYINAD